MSHQGPWLSLPLSLRFFSSYLLSWLQLGGGVQTRDPSIWREEGCAG
jgi:hypothetical protein